MAPPMLLLLASAAVAAAAATPVENRLQGQSKTVAVSHPSTLNVSTHWYEQTLDHFSWGPTPEGQLTFRQKYLVHQGYWQKGGPIFFYCGNEASVDLYVNNTGLMWENAPTFGAALVFMEHRFYGESLPFGSDSEKHLQYLTMEQALADYATFIPDLKALWDSPGSAVIGFGGSYGGMLSAWLRMKYPHALDGAIAASAPILAFQGLGTGFDAAQGGEVYWQVVTRDATPAAGAAEGCADRVREAWPALFDLGSSAQGRRRLESVFRICGEAPLQTEKDVMKLARMQLDAWDSMAMGNYPYPSNYLVFANLPDHDPSVKMPAFPVRVACQRLVAGAPPGDAVPSERLLAAMHEATSVFLNVSGSTQCLELPQGQEDPVGIWDYQWCTELLPQESYYTRDGVSDMFWPQAFNATAVAEHCRQVFGINPRPQWIATEFGGTAGASNIVFSNGLYDPWSSGGVLKDVSETAVAVVIPEGAHHLDLMFSDPLDPPSVLEARAVELQHIRRWIDGARQVAVAGRVAEPVEVPSKVAAQSAGSAFLSLGAEVFYS